MSDVGDLKERTDTTPVRILFICSRNRIRSLTAEHLLAGESRFLVRSAGTAESARIRVTSGHVRWAEIIVVMEPRHREMLQSRFRTELGGKRLVCLLVPDEFTYGSEELIMLLENRLAAHLPDLFGPPATGDPPHGH